MNENIGWLAFISGRELEELRQIKCCEIGGMDNFREERSKIMKLAYTCLKNTDKTFGECQKMAWDLQKSLTCEK